MRQLVLEELHLCSYLEKKAKKVVFQEGKNLVLGNNRTGKSSILKNIFWVLGINVKHHPAWKNVNAYCYLKFRFGNKKYGILRHGDIFKLFDSDEKLIGTYDTVTSGVGLELAKIFGFRLTLTDRNGLSVTPPPAYLFVPYYIDQDLSWNEKLGGFKSLGQFSDWRKDVIDYHLGIKPDEYYRYKSLSTSAQGELKEIDKELSIITSIEKRHSKQLPSTEFNIDFDEFKTQIAKLLTDLGPLKILEGKYKEDLKKLYGDKLRFENQIRASSSAKDNLSKDLDYCEHSGEVIACPTCGSEYENSFEERMSIAQDIGDIAGLILDLQQELKTVDEKINKVNTKSDEVTKNIQEIQKSLSDRKEKITLMDIIKSEGAKESARAIATERGSVQQKRNSKQSEIDGYETERKKFVDPERVKDVKQKFTDYMAKYLHSLEVFNLPERAYKNPDCNLDETGSDLPRALIAYFFAFSSTAEEMNKDGFQSPLVIDSPNTGGQDKYRLPMVYKFITDNTPSNTQLILGVESLPDDFDIKKYHVIKVSKSYSLLLEEEYQEVSSVISRLISK